MTTPTSARQLLRSRGAACARRRGRRSWTASPGRPRRGWIRSSGARENLWSRGATAQEASGSLSRRAPPANTRRRTRQGRRARCSERCSRREAAAGGSAGAGGRSSNSSRRSARCAWRSSGPGTCWRTSPARTASTGPAPCPGSRPPPAAPSAAPPSASPTTSMSSARWFLLGRTGPGHGASVERRGTVADTCACMGCLVSWPRPAGKLQRVGQRRTAAAAVYGGRVAGVT